MARGLTYADAAVLLGGQSKVVVALDRLTGGALLAASAAGAGFALSLFDAKSELFRLSAELLEGLTGKLRGASRLTRTERLSAAHTVIVITALFEAIRETELPFGFHEADLTAAEQRHLTHDGTKLLAKVLVRGVTPTPLPDRSYEQSLADLRSFYRERVTVITLFLTGLAVWESMSETDRTRSEQIMVEEVPERAVRRYEELFRRLAGEFPEFACWVGLVEHRATRTEVRALRTALAGLAEDLAAITAGGEPDPTRRELARANQAALRRPVLPTDQAGLTIPTVAESYVNPDFRVATDVPADQVTRPNWWTSQPRRADLQRFLIGYLTNPAAQHAPLVVLGQPGAGKSLLTQVLAARLPAADFLTVRVPLRDVIADADLQTQIEQAVRAATGETLTWPQLTRSAPGALPVILLDGYDELLQATEIRQSSFLEKVAAFQQRESDQERPVAVLVTSRISVADRARPVAGMTTVVLEPFDDEQLADWLSVWNAANAVLPPLHPDTVLAHRDLAEQPLLLLMLALYDAETNALQAQGSELNQAGLYERLLTTFARREVRKSAADLPDEDIDRAVEQELLTLSVVSFAMFNRLQQWVSEPDLDVDLAALLPTNAPTPTVEPYAPLTAAQAVVGRFYFVHVAQALRDDTRLRTFEFLHATFGEYLIARLVVTELTDLANTPTRGRPRAVDDSFLHALLSFAPLTNRRTVTSFLEDLLWLQSVEARERAAHTALGLFHVALEPRSTSLDTYRPFRASGPRRYAAYSVNLLLLAVLAAGELTGVQLFPGRSNPNGRWASIAHLWWSQLPIEGWQNLTREIIVHRYSGENYNLDVLISHGDRFESGEPVWIPHYHLSYPPLKRGEIISSRDLSELVVDVKFHGNFDHNMLLHALNPMLPRLGTAVTTVHHLPGQDPTSAAQALITLWLASSQRSSPELVADAAGDCLEIATNGFVPNDPTRAEYERTVLRHLVNVLHLLPEDWPEILASAIDDAQFDHDEKQTLLTRLGPGHQPASGPE